MNKPQNKFDFIVEEVTSRYQQGGLVTGDFVLIRKDALKNDKLKGRPSNFIEKLKEIIATKLPLRVSAVKSERPESSNDLIGGANHSGTNYWVDVCIEYAPGLWRDPMTLPLEVLDINNPSDYNLPSWPDEVKRDNKLEIKPTKIKTDKKELNIKQTQGDQRALDTKNVKIPVGKVKDGRDQTKVKESVEDLTEQEKMEQVLQESLYGNFGYLTLGPTPAGEECCQLGKHDMQMHRIEVRAYINQLKRMFPNETPDAYFIPKREEHDFGTYYEAAVKYNENDEKAVDFAFKVEGNLPEHWDDEAKAELDKHNYFQHIAS